jgi:hypothetical protein
MQPCSSYSSGNPEDEEIFPRAATGAHLFGRNHPALSLVKDLFFILSDWPLIIILGPTASGKSGLAIRLAAEFSGEILNCDSIQVYRRLNIGTAKPNREEQAGIPHHLVDFL